MDKILTVWQVKEKLQVFQALESFDSNYVPKLQEIWKDLKVHIKEEEEKDLPAMEDALNSAAGESESMAKSFERTKNFVPSRSHPMAGEHPPFETAMALLTAPIDYVADVFRKFPCENL